MLFRSLHEKQLNDLDSASLNRLVMAQLLIHISRAFSAAASGLPKRNGQRYKEIMGVYDYISAHLKDTLSVTELAELFFMDKNTLTRQFKRITGMTPAECIRRKRLDAAYTMISHGAGVTESCHECGFFRLQRVLPRLPPDLRRQPQRLRRPGAERREAGTVGGHLTLDIGGIP